MNTRWLLIKWWLQEHKQPLVIGVISLAIVGTILVSMPVPFSQPVSEESSGAAFLPHQPNANAQAPARPEIAPAPEPSEPPEAEYNFVTRPTLNIKPEVAKPGDLIMLSGKDFLAINDVTIEFNGKTETVKTDVIGSFRHTITLSKDIKDGIYSITASDPTGGTVKARLTVARTPLAKTEKVEENQVITTDRESERIPPTSSYSVKGEQTCNTINKVQRCWYYNVRPVVTFQATDNEGGSGVKHIVVQGRVQGSNCRNSECYVLPNGSVTLTHESSVDSGRIRLTYFAVDNNGNKEEPKNLDIWADLQAPKLHILKIRSDSKSSIPVGYSDCRPDTNVFIIKMSVSSTCYPIELGRMETVTIEMLASDRISGIDKVYARVGTEKPWSILSEGMNEQPVFSTLFEKTGIYVIQFYAADIAGNKSDTITMFVVVR